MDLPKPSDDISQAKVTEAVSERRNEERITEPAAINIASNQESNGKSTRPLRQKRRASSHPPVAEMVLESIRYLKKRKGASVEDIHSHIGENYDVNMKYLKSHVNRFLSNAVQQGILEQVEGADVLYKIKKDTQNTVARESGIRNSTKEMDKSKNENRNATVKRSGPGDGVKEGDQSIKENQNATSKGSGDGSKEMDKSKNDKETATSKASGSGDGMKKMDKTKKKKQNPTKKEKIVKKKKKPTATRITKPKK